MHSLLSLTFVAVLAIISFDARAFTDSYSSWAPATGAVTSGALVNIQRGSVTYTAASGTSPTPVSISTVDPDHSILSFSNRGGATASARVRKHVWGGTLAASNIQFTRFEASTAEDSTIEYEVLEFGSDVLVQRGSFAVVDATTNIALGTTADPTRSFVLFSHTQNNIDLTQGQIARAALTSGGANLTFTFSTDPPTAGALTIYWQVVTFPADAASVQAGTISLGADVASNTATISAVNTGKTFLVHGGISGDNTSYGSLYPYSLELTNSTTITARKNINSVDPNLVIQYFAVEMLNPTTVTQVSGTILNTATTPAAQPSFATLTNPSLMLSTPGYSVGGWLDYNTKYEADYLVSYAVDGTKDGLTVARTGTNGEYDFSLFVIDWYKP